MIVSERFLAAVRSRLCLKSVKLILKGFGLVSRALVRINSCEFVDRSSPAW
jgi:hypothetical protein